MDSVNREPGFVQGIVLLLPITLAVTGISVLTPVVHLLIEQFKDVPNHEYLVIGGVLTMPAIWVLLFSPLAGWLADRFGRRKILLVAMVAYAVVGVAPAFLHDLYAIIVSRAAVGVCESVVMTVSTTMISDYFQGRARERWLASQTAVASVSALGIIFIGGELGAAFGWRGPFYVYAYSIPLAVTVFLFTWEPRSPGASAVPDGGREDVPAAVFPWARILGKCALTLLGSISFYTVITKNAEALVALGVNDPVAIGRSTMLASIGVPLGTFVYWGVSRLPIGRLLFLDFILIGVGFVLMGHAADAGAYTVGSFVNQLGCGLVLPTLLVWTTSGLDYAVRGRGNGFWQAAFAIGQFLSGMVVTALGEHLGGLLLTFVVMGKAAVACAIVVFLVSMLWRNSKPPVALGI